MHEFMFIPRTSRRPHVDFPHRPRGGGAVGNHFEQRRRSVSHGTGELLADVVGPSGIGFAAVGVEADAVADDGTGEFDPVTPTGRLL